MKKTFLTASLILALGAGLYIGTQHNTQSGTYSDLQETNVEALSGNENMPEYAKGCLVCNGYTCHTGPDNYYHDAKPYNP